MIGLTPEVVVAADALDRHYVGPPPITALRDVSLSIRRHETVSIVGPSGSGKSTLLQIVGLLDRPSSGSLTLSGERAEHLSERARTALRAKLIGFVFQSSILFGRRSVIDNVTVGGLYTGTSTRELQNKAAELIELLGLNHRIHARADRLSGGERQRVAIARALVRDPALVICDEPTGNLDSETSKRVIDALRSVASQDSAVLIATHDPDVAAVSDRTIELRSGRVSQ